MTKQLGAYVFQRRVDAGLSSRRALAEKAGIAKRTVDTLEAGGSVSESTIYKVEKALDLPPGTLVAVQRGEPGAAPLPEPDAEETQQTEEFNEQVVEKAALMLYAPAESGDDEAYLAMYDFLRGEIGEELALRALKRTAQMSIKRARGEAG